MGLFSADLYKSFAIGFVLGTVALAGAMAFKANDGVIPQAQAATAMPDQTLVAAADDASR